MTSSTALTRRQKTTRRLGVLGFLMSPLLAALPGCGEAEAVPVAAEPLPVRVVGAEAVASITTARSYTGEMKARREATLGFETAGRIVQLAVDEGAVVAAGDVLGEVDVATLAARRARVVAERDEAAARLSELEAGPRVQEIRAAEAEVRQLDADLALAKSRLGRRRTLAERNAITREEYDESRFTAEAVAARRDAAAERLSELREGTRAEQVTAQRARVAALGAAVAEIDEQIADATLRAPFDARVVERMRDDGSVVAAGEAVFRVVEDVPPEAWVGVPAETAATLSPGDPVSLRLRGEDRPGLVRDVLAELSPTTRTRTVIATLSDGPGDRAAAVSGEVVRLVVRRPRDLPDSAVRIPRDTLVRGTRGLWACFVVAAGETADGATGEIARRDVELLELDGADAVVRGTLSPGDRVVAAGTHRVVPGQTVRVLETARPGEAVTEVTR